LQNEHYTAVYNDFTHPPPSASESIPESFIQEAISSTLFANVKGVTFDSILDAVKSTASDSNIQLPNDDIASQYVKDILSTGLDNEDIIILGGDKYSLSYTCRVSIVLEELANTNNSNDGTSAEDVVKEIKRRVGATGRVSVASINKAIIEGAKDGRYICNKNLYKIQPLYGLSNEEKNEIKDTKQNVEKGLSGMADEMDNNESSEEEDNQPPKKRKKINKPKKISKRDKGWNDMFDKLKLYKADHGGDTNVPQRYSLDDKLGKWVQTQRIQYKKKNHGQLTDERIQKLLSIGFTFNQLDKEWNDMFDKLKLYKANHGGDTNVPFTYSRDPSLGNWVSHQRRQFKKTNNGQLTDERIQKLQSIGFTFSQQDQQWNDMFDKLKLYKANHGGDTNVPFTYSRDPSLGNWVSHQRRQFKKTNNGQLTDERIQKLQSIGFTFSQQDQQWNDMFDKLKLYKADHGGDTNVPQGYNPDPQLGTWVNTQRTQYQKVNNGSLTTERINRLDEIGFEWVWKSPNMKWVVAVLKKFHNSTSTEEEKRHCHVPYPTTTNSQPLKKVWPFVSQLRKRVRQGKKIPEWLVDELSPLGFELDPQSYRARRKRVETKFLHDLEVNHKIEWNAWDEKIENSDSRPDAFIVWEYDGKFYIIFKEIDEHRHDDRSIVYEQTRMTKLAVLAKKLGFVGIYFVRTNSAERKDIDPIQQAGVAKLLWSIKDEPQDGVHVRYVDFPSNHHHYVASVARRIDEDEDEVDLATGEEGEHHMLPLFDSVDKVFTGCEAGV